MTPQDHHKILGIMYLIYGGFYALMTVMMCVLFLFVGGMISSLPREADAPPPAFFFGIMAFVLALNLIFSVPSLIAGYGLLKKKQWGRTAGIVAAICAAMSIPFGTALCVYSLWFFLGESGKPRFGEFEKAGAHGTLSDSHSTFGAGWGGQTVSDEREHAYVPPPQPPDWRG